MVATSPSPPRRPLYGGAALGQSSSLATLQRTYNDAQKHLSSTPTQASGSRSASDASGRHRQNISSEQSSAVPRQNTYRIPSPGFSIDAVSESDDDLVSALMRSTNRGKTEPSPKIGDLTWSNEETGPFGVGIPSSSAKFSAPDMQASLSTASSMQRAGSFDLDTAIADLLLEDEARRKARRIAGFDSVTPETASKRSSLEADPVMMSRITSLAKPAHIVSRQPSIGGSSMYSQPSMMSTLTAAKKDEEDLIKSADSAQTTPKRARAGSSSGVKGAHGARLPSSSSVQSVRASKRSSSASIGHSLLRGSLPFGAAEDFEGRLSGSDDAAEALRKLDGIRTPRGSTSLANSPYANSNAKIRDPSRSPRTSKQLVRPGSAGHRASGNASRGSSPSGNKSTTGAPRQSRDDFTPRTSGSRRTSKNLSGKGKPVEDPTISSIAASETPRRTSLSSPRTRRSQLPPLPTSSSMLPLGLSTPPSAQIGLSGLSNAAVNKHVSVSSLTSNNPSAVQRTSTATRNKRMSDGSPLDPLQPLNGGLGLTDAADEVLPATSSTQHLSELSIPPVPPLPKAWESSRSLHSTLINDTSVDVPAIASANSSMQYRGKSPGDRSNEDTPPHTTKSPSSKWGWSNLSTLTSRKSEEKLANRKSTSNASEMHGKRASVGSTRLSGKPEKVIPKNSLEERRQKIDSSSLSQTNDSSPLLNASASQHTTRVSSEQAAASQPSPRARRTPSFFRKRSSDAPSNDDSARRSNKSPSLLSQERTRSPSIGQTDMSQPSRSEATTPSGRSSRKSMLGLGSLLRSASKRNIDSMPTNTPTQYTTAQSKAVNGTAPGEGVGTAREENIKPPSMSQAKASGALGTFRRASLIGRKRGKTLPSSNEPPIRPEPMQQLPPMQVPPLNETQLSPPRKRESKAMSNSTSSDSFASRRRLINSSSTGDLNAPSHVMREKSNAPALPTINASPLDAVSGYIGVRPETDGSTANAKVSGTDNVTTASRIPRATTIGSSKKASLPSSSSTSFVRKLSGAAGSGLPTSKTSSTLASHLGIATSRATDDGVSVGEFGEQVNVSNTGAATLSSILTAYTNAKTAAEVEVVLRRARVASYSSMLSPREKEVLVSLIARQEEKKRQQVEQNGALSKSLMSTPQSHRVSAGVNRSPTHPRMSSGTFSSSVRNDVPASNASAKLLNPLPARKARASMTAVSNSARLAREAANLPPPSRLSTPSSARMSPALSDTLMTRSVSTASPGPSTPVDDSEREGDAEIEAYIQRRHTRKVAQGARLSDLEKLLDFPETEKPSKAYSYRQAEALWGDKMTPHELDEIRDYKEIYFCGPNVDKSKRVPADGGATQNNGFDDERGDYIVINHDHLAFRYEVMSLLGRGSFGQVLQCKDHKTGQHVAIKLIRNKRRFHHQALVEVKILENLVKWDPQEEYNVITVRDSFYFRSHLCISMELMSINLYELIKANSFAGFSTKLIRRLTSQVLLSLSLLRRNRVVHCDLKPENILLKHPRKSAIKVIDFGSSCFEHEKVYTYIQSRFYRSPEVILGMNYHTAIDIWSLGCIVAELYSGYPLFPGENEQEQLACIMEVLGVPDRYLIERSSRRKLFFDSTGAPRPVVNSKGKRRRPNTKTLGSVLNCHEDMFIDFLSKCLHWDPERRIKPDAALRHAWIRRQTHRPDAIMGAMNRRVSGMSSSPATNGQYATMGNGSVDGTPHAPRRTIAASTTTSALLNNARQPSTISSLSSSTSTPKVSSYAPSNTAARHERRISLRASAAAAAANGSAGSAIDAVQQSPLRASQRNQQPVQ